MSNQSVFDKKAENILVIFELDCLSRTIRYGKGAISREDQNMVTLSVGSSESLYKRNEGHLWFPSHKESEGHQVPLRGLSKEMRLGQSARFTPFLSKKLPTCGDQKIAPCLGRNSCEDRSILDHIYHKGYSLHVFQKRLWLYNLLLCRNAGQIFLLSKLAFSIY